MAIGEITDIFPQQLIEHTLLIIGDDTVADCGQHHPRAVGCQTSGRKNHHRQNADDDDALEIVMNVGLVGHRAEKIGG